MTDRLNTTEGRAPLNILRRSGMIKVSDVVSKEELKVGNWVEREWLVIGTGKCSWQ
jgi:hypothetical protein